MRSGFVVVEMEKTSEGVKENCRFVEFNKTAIRTLVMQNSEIKLGGEVLEMVS